MKPSAWKLTRLKVILMKTLFNGEYAVSTGHNLYTGMASTGGTAMHLIELLAKGCPVEISHTTQAVAETNN